MLTDNSFQNISDPVAPIAESFISRLFRLIKGVAREVVKDPEAMINIQRIIQDVRDEHEEYMVEATDWVDESLPVAYMRGLKETDGTIRKLDVDAEATAPIASRQLIGSGGGGGAIAPTASEILRNYPRHHTMYSVFQEAAYNDFARTQFPVVRDVQGKVREIIIQASEAQYQEANVFTRRQMSQDLMNRFADRNITGIVYSDGRRVNIDAYSEMVARSQTGNAARQASMNRQQQYGYDLVRISTHFPCSDLCVDEQGKVYSISGSSDQYPPLEDAISNGLYHSNCKHFQNPYFPGISPKQEVRQQELGKRENRQRFELTQQQRYNERNIRKWKRRESAALTDDAREKARGKVSDWQARQRELVDDNSFLRRKYQRESIN